MKIFGSKVLALSSAIVMAGGLLAVGSPAFAATTSSSSTGTASITVAPGSLGFSSTQSSISGTFTVGTSPSPVSFFPPYVTDNTGSGLGWTETVQASNPVEVMPSGATSTPITLASADVAVTAGTPTGGSGTAPTDNSAFSSGNAYVQINAGSPVTLMSAGTDAGMGGSWYQFAHLEVTVPSTVVSQDSTNYPGQATPYSVTLTYTLTQG